MLISGKVVKKSVDNLWVNIVEKKPSVKKVIQFIRCRSENSQILHKKIHRIYTGILRFLYLLVWGFPLFPQTTTITTIYYKERGFNMIISKLLKKKGFVWN